MFRNVIAAAFASVAAFLCLSCSSDSGHTAPTP